MEGTSEPAPTAPAAPPEERRSSRKLLAVILTVVVIIAAGAAAYVLTRPPPTVPTHDFQLVADSDWFEVPSGGVANITGSMFDIIDPVFGVPVTVTADPSDLGTLGATSGETDNSGVATFAFTTTRRLENVSVDFTLTGEIEGQTLTDTTTITILAEGVRPQFGQVKGRIIGSGAALANATVQVIHLGTDESFLNTTDDRGRFLVMNVAPGTVSVTATKSGFKTTGRDVLVVAGKNTFVTMTLNPLAAGTLLVWHTYEGKEKDEFNKIIDRYRALKGISIEVEAQPFGGAIDKYITAALAGNAPDVMRFQNDRLGEVAKIELLEPLDPYLAPEDLARFDPLSLEAMQYNGKLYALPATADLLAIVYNKGIFEAAGEPFPDEDWTTDDFMRITQNLTDEANDRWGFVQPVTDPFWWFPWHYGFGGYIFAGNLRDADRVTAASLGFDTTESAKSLQWLQSLDKDPAMRTMPPRPGSESMMAFFFQGQAAMVAIGAWRVPDMYAAGIDFGIVPYPVVSETGERAAPTLGVKGFGVYKFSALKQAAVDLVKFITSDEQQILFSIGTNDLPTAVAAFNNATIAGNPIIIQYQRQAAFAQRMPTRPEMGAMWNPITAAMEVVYNRASPTLQDIQQDMTAAEQQIVQRIG